MKNSLLKMCPDLAEEWSERNAPLTPDTVSYGTHTSFWWIGKCGHEWKASPHNRTGKNRAGCPYCSGNKILPGFNDLKSQFPEIASEWSERNLPLKPEQVTPFSNRKVWWEGKCGHEWQAVIASRSEGHDCPYCKDHKILAGFNDLRSMHPKLAEEWSEKNFPLTPDIVPVTRNGMFWWNCLVCKGEYQAWIQSRINGSKCPYCSGRKIKEGINDLTTTDPDIASEWADERNGNMTPKKIHRTSRKVFWWKCPKGHFWQAKVYERTIGGITCRECEKEFLRILPRLLLIQYCSRKGLKVLMNTDSMIGIPFDICIPEIKAAFDFDKSLTCSGKIREVKTHICSVRGIRYFVIRCEESAEESVKEVRRILSEIHLYFNSKAAEDISIARKQYELIKRK